MAAYVLDAAHAANPAPTIEFSIPAGTLTAVLVKFAVQSNISLGLGAVDACAAPAHGLAGRYTVEEGLQRILIGTGCRYRVLDARAYVIQPLPRAFASPMLEAAETPISVEVAELVVVAPRGTTPDDLSNLTTTDDLATTVSNVLGSQSDSVCDGCSVSEAFPILGAAPVPATRPGPDLAAEVSEPGTWATMLLGLGALGANLRRRRDHVVNGVI